MRSGGSSPSGTSTQLWPPPNPRKDALRSCMPLPLAHCGDTGSCGHQSLPLRLLSFSHLFGADFQSYLAYSNPRIRGGCSILARRASAAGLRYHAHYMQDRSNLRGRALEPGGLPSCVAADHAVLETTPSIYDCHWFPSPFNGSFRYCQPSWRNGFPFAMRAILSRKRGIAIEDQCHDVLLE
jgi:hypothetical protein